MTDRLIKSAALYFRSDDPPRVPILWLTSAIDFFSSQGITIDYFDAAATGVFSGESTFDFIKHKSDLFMAVKEGLVESIGLYSNPSPTAPRSAWQAMASLEVELGLAFLGIEDAGLPRHEFLLRSAYLMGGEALGVRYGISFERVQSKGPDSYAAGVLQGSLGDIKSWLASQGEADRRLSAWRNEQFGSRRYLSGLFRGAYPASIVSRGHLVAIQDRAHGRQLPGKLTPLVANNLWIWVLADSDIIAAEKLLRDCSLLVE
jgi:hypothetical protein